MKKLILSFSLVLLSLIGFGQYTGDKLPSGLTVADTASDADVTIMQYDGEVIVKAIRMDSLRSYMTEGMAASATSLDSISGTTGQFIVSDGSGWVSPVSAVYEGSGAYSFGYRIGTVGWGSFVAGGSPTDGNEASLAYSMAWGPGGAAATAYGATAWGNGTASGIRSTAFSSSTASGANSTAWYSGVASGIGSTAWFYGNASGLASTAWGNAVAPGDHSTAWGGATANTDYSTAWGKGTASGRLSTAWDSLSVASGIHSTAWGKGTASGLYSTALAEGTASGDNSFAVDATASGDYSFAFSGGTASGQISTAWDGGTASGIHSTVWGKGTASGDYSTAFNIGNATGDYSTAWGYQDTASGIGSTCWGYSSAASGDYSTAWTWATASGKYSTAWIWGTASGERSTAWHYGTASGASSTASGIGVFSNSYNEFSLGRYGDTITATSATTWQATDWLFSIQNGTAGGSRSNALVMLKNGNTEVTGDWTIDGDLEVTGDVNFSASLPAISAHVPGDSTLVTTVLTGVPIFLGTGDNIQFVVTENLEFAYDGDTLYFDGSANATVFCCWNGTAETTTVTTTVHIHIYVNDVIVEQFTGATYCKAANEEYALSGGNGLVALTNGDTIKLMVEADDGCDVTNAHLNFAMFKIK